MYHYLIQGQTHVSHWEELIVAKSSMETVFLEAYEQHACIYHLDIYLPFMTLLSWLLSCWDSDLATVLNQYWTFACFSSFFSFNSLTGILSFHCSDSSSFSLNELTPAGRLLHEMSTFVSIAFAQPPWNILLSRWMNCFLCSLTHEHKWSRWKLLIGMYNFQYLVMVGSDWLVR